MHENNIINEPNEMELEVIQEYKDNERLVEPFFPLITYDMVQVGYPYPDHGVMVARSYRGTDIENKLLDGGGMWCKVDDVKKLLNEKDDSKTL